MASRSWFPFIALSLAFAIAAGAFSTSPPIRTLLALAAGASLLRAISLATSERRASKYDLGALKDFHEREEARQIELDEPEEFDSVHCFHCGTVYSNQLPACPHCGRS